MLLYEGMLAKPASPDANNIRKAKKFLQNLSSYITGTYYGNLQAGGRARKHILSNFLDMTKYKKYDLYNFANFPHLREVT